MIAQMSTQEIMNFLSFAFGIIGVVIAIIQGFERKKLKQFMHSQSWHLYSVSQLTFGSSQSALKTYKDKTKNEIDRDIYEQLSKCEAFNISLFLEVIRQIQLSEPKFDFETITAWKMQGRISDNVMPYFIKAIAMKTPGIPRMALDVLTIKIRKMLTKAISNKNYQDNTKTN